MELISMKPDEGDQLGFNSTPVNSIYHASSFSSSAHSSSYGEPFTPTSGRSTPLSLSVGPLENEMSFSSMPDGLPYLSTITPPPPSTSGDFGMALKTDPSSDYILSAPNLFAGHDGATQGMSRSLPVISSPYSHLGNVYSMHGSFRSKMSASPGCVDIYSPSHSLHFSPSVVPSTGRLMPDQEMACHWPPEEEEYGDLFSHESASLPVLRSIPIPPFKYEHVPSTSSYQRPRRRLHAAVRHSSAALQRAQNGGGQPSMGKLGSSRRGKVASSDNATGNNSNHGFPIDTVPKGSNPCSIPGCKKRFARSEHLSRHERTAHNCTVWYKCWSCDNFSNRLDNWREHLKRHCDPSKTTGSTKYDEEMPRRLAAERHRLSEPRKDKPKLPPGIIWARTDPGGDPKSVPPSEWRTGTE